MSLHRRLLQGIQGGIAVAYGILGQCQEVLPPPKVAGILDQQWVNARPNISLEKLAYYVDNGPPFPSISSPFFASCGWGMEREA